MDEFEGIERVIDYELSFKNKLGIGEDAFASLRRKKQFEEFVRIFDAAGAFGAGAALAAAAGPLFAPAPAGLAAILAGLGIGAAAVMPIGWVIAAGAASTAAYYGISRYLRSGRKERVDVVPKWINTPLALLAVALFDFFAPLGVKVASLDGSVSDRERQYIEDYFVREWGYSKEFVQFAIPKLETNVEAFPTVELVDNMIKFKNNNPDCNYEAMSNELVDFLKEVTRADGKLHDQEVIFIQWLEIVLERGKPGFWDELYSAIGLNEKSEKNTHKKSGPTVDPVFGEDAPDGSEKNGKQETKKHKEDNEQNSTWIGRNFQHALHWTQDQF